MMLDDANVMKVYLVHDENEANLLPFKINDAAIRSWH
jgi:hypothetical protein